jgi:hypothetical protein
MQEGIHNLFTIDEVVPTPLKKSSQKLNALHIGENRRMIPPKLKPVTQGPRTLNDPVTA